MPGHGGIFRVRREAVASKHGLMPDSETLPLSMQLLSLLQVIQEAISGEAVDPGSVARWRDYFLPTREAYIAAEFRPAVYNARLAAHEKKTHLEAMHYGKDFENRALDQDFLPFLGKSPIISVIPTSEPEVKARTMHAIHHSRLSCRQFYFR